MKKIVYLLCSAIFLLFACEVENIDTETEQFNTFDVLNASFENATVLRSCTVADADRCPFGDRQPASSMWWPENPNDFFVTSAYFSVAGQQLTFTEFEDGTANIRGTVAQGTCVVAVDIWLSDRSSYTEWSAAGGSFKEEGCAGLQANAEEMTFYSIDTERSSITATGGDCIAEGTFGIEQRPDPNDPNTENFGVNVGPGGAGLDSDLDAEGLSTWAWITDPNTGERLWVLDFNFTFECEMEEPECETAFARGDNGDTCFLDNGFNRWGWSIGPLEEGDYTYEIYAAAGQCDIEKGSLVGTVDVSYQDGDVEVTYNIDDAYTVEETHTYAGNEMFPVTKKGKPTVAPGQYTIAENLDGTIFVIAHAVVCQ